MTSYNTPDLHREPCEGCPGEALPTFYCAQCDCNFCDTCWDHQPAHRPNKRGTDGQAHERIDRLVVERYRNILEPTSNSQEQEDLHKDDEDTTWFGIGHNEAGEPVFEDYEQYATLIADSLSEAHKIRYPQLVSFIGQTGAGKSTLVKMLINHQDMKTNRTDQLQFPSPVVGSVNDNVPVSANVHLYADPETRLTKLPVLYADCEGLEGGESAPRADALKSRDRASDDSRQKNSLASSKKKRFYKNAPRNLPWAAGDKEKSKREYAVTELYPRLLYTFSDVVVFVLRNPKTFESAVLTKLIGWASASFESSLGQPALPHIIIALNATDLAIDSRQWDVEEATQKLLSDVEASVQKIPALQTHVSNWRLNGRSIKTTKDLLECYYSSVTVVRIPTKGRYMLTDQQVKKLHTEIVIKCNQSHHMKRRERMLSNSDDLQLYLQLAFDHFSQTLEHPFNFIEAALRINPIPSNFSGNIIKLALAIRNHLPTAKVEMIFAHLSLMVASCIMLDIHRHRRLGTPNQLLEDHYMTYCEQAFSDFCNRHWQCSFSKRKERCANFYFGHASKGHQNKEGKVLESGEFVPSFHYRKDLAHWIQRLERDVIQIQELKNEALPKDESDLSAERITSKLHLGNINKFYTRLGNSCKYMSHSTCFCCLSEIPVHPLSCGHVLCTPCVRSYGRPNGRGLIEITECPIGMHGERWLESCLIQFKPPLAGVRVLCLDGGGIRGIVELEVLSAIQKELPAGISINQFFDLIVGTSTGGIIALGLGVEGWSVDECIQRFKEFCKTAFTPRELQEIPVLRLLSMVKHGYSKYKTKPLEDVLKKSFPSANEPLFGGKHSQLSVRVAVTSTKETGSQAVIMTNYNRSLQNINHSAEYWFERAERPENELTVWEAARSTSAAPSYFKVFKSARNNCGYLDGALYHNNPVRVADLERRLIWPDTEGSPPDILLSIGTSCNEAINEEAKEAKHDSWPTENDPMSDKSTTPASGSRQKFFVSNRKRTQTGKLIKIMKNRVENILDTEITWSKFLSGAAQGDKEDRSRYLRINPNIKVDPPKLDAVKDLFELQEQVQRMTKDPSYQKKVGGVARRLVASCFYVETSSLPTNVQESDTTIDAVIQCRFSSGSREIRHLGEYLKNVTTQHFQPYFIIKETNSITENRKERITLDLIQNMMMNASFEVGPLAIRISNEAAITTICLSIAAGEELPISGSPRALIPNRIAQALPPAPDKSQSKLKQPPRYMNVGDDTGSHSSETSSIAFPGLQKLSREGKIPIRNFVQEKILSLQSKGEDVPIKLWLLAGAVDNVDNQQEEAVDSSDSEQEETVVDDEIGPFGSILHTAATIGLHWIVDMQIKAGVDLTALDHHSWTALMVATAQRHNTCARLLSEHMRNTEASSLPDVLSPSGLVKTQSNDFIELGSDNLTATPGSWHYNLQRRASVRSNHPIPPKSPSFYYEITILQTGPLNIIGLGLCRPETSAFGMPGWHKTSWGYHGDGGNKFNSSSEDGCWYAQTYTKNDTVGCGINMQTRKVFFTLNGSNLGVAFTNVTGMLFPTIGFGEREGKVRVNFGTELFIYDIDAHDWEIERTAVALQVRAHPLRFSGDGGNGYDVIMSEGTAYS